MGEKLKGLAGLIFGGAVVVAMIGLAVIFLKGAMWGSENLLPPLITAGSVAFAIILFVLLPLSLIRKLRPFTGGAIFLSSYLFGLICWFVGFITTYILWGLWAIIVGLLFLGGGVVPIAMLASIFKGEWTNLAGLVVMVILTFGARIGGMYIAEHSNQQ